MNDANDTVVHVFPGGNARGGIESVLSRHAGLPGKQVSVALFERSRGPKSHYVALGFTGWTSLAAMRAEFRRALAPYAGSLVVYHNGWGFSLFCDLDGASRRVVMLHANPAYHAPDLGTFRDKVDGVIAITPMMRAAAIAALPELTKARAQVFRVPIEFPPELPVKEAVQSPLVLGWAGRVELRQKRLDRLPVFLDALEARGIDFRFELIGEGSYRAALANAVGARVQFHGWVSREDYWRIMARWDAVVFFSDAEGGPIALLEGMASGALPFHPALGGSWAEIHAREIDSRCAYPPGDMHALATAIAGVFGASRDEIRRSRELCRQLVAAHTDENYLKDLGGFLETIRRLPGIAKSTPRRPTWRDCLPLGVVTRFASGALQRG